MTTGALTLNEAAHQALNGPGDVPAFQVNGQWINWQSVKNVADAVETALTAAGISPDTTVALAPLNRFECCAALLGLVAEKRDVLMVYAYQSPEAFTRKVSELGCAALIAPAHLLTAPVLEVLAGISTLAVALDGERVTVVGSAPQPETRSFPHAATPGIALLSSGTTGAPKAIHINYDQLERALLKETNIEARDPTPQLHFFPMGNVSGVYVYIPNAIVRRPIILLEKFSVTGWLDHIRRYRPETSTLPPAGFRMVLDADVPHEDLSSLRYIVTGSARLDPSVHRAFEKHYGIPILQSYGATEFGGTAAAMTPADLARFGDAKFGSVGRAWGDVRFRVVDTDTGEIMTAGAEGRLEVLPSRMGPRWIRTTDIAMLDDDGFLYICGRSDGAITRGGFKILPEVITAALTEHPSVAAAAVLGIPDEILGQVPVAAYEVRPGAASPKPEELNQFLRDRLPSTHIPIGYRQFDPLPRNPSMKLDLAALHQQLGSWVSDKKKPVGTA